MGLLTLGPSINYVGSLRGRGGSANHLFLPIMPNMFAYEGGVKNSKNHAYVVYGRSLSLILKITFSTLIKKSSIIEAMRLVCKSG